MLDYIYGGVNNKEENSGHSSMYAVDFCYVSTKFIWSIQS